MFNKKVFVTRDDRSSGIRLVVIDPEFGFMARHRNYKIYASPRANSEGWRFKRFSEMKEEGGPQLKLLKIGEKEFNGQTYMSYQVKEGDKSVILFLMTSLNLTSMQFLRNI